MDFGSKQCPSLRPPHSHTAGDRVMHTFTVTSTAQCTVCPPGIRTELREKWGPRTRKFEDLLKDRPTKYSLRREGFRLEPVPPLDVVVWSRDGEVRGCGSEERVFQPGSGGRRRSLKVDGNVVPVRYQRTPSPGRREELRERHDRGFSPSPGRREELRERHDRDFRCSFGICLHI